jgi:hypothetical protein
MRASIAGKIGGGGCRSMSAAVNTCAPSGSSEVSISVIVAWAYSERTNVAHSAPPSSRSST